MRYIHGNDQTGFFRLKPLEPWTTFGARAPKYVKKSLLQALALLYVITYVLIWNVYSPPSLHLRSVVLYNMKLGLK